MGFRRSGDLSELHLVYSRGRDSGDPFGVPAKYCDTLREKEALTETAMPSYAAKPDPHSQLELLYARLADWMSITHFEESMDSYFNGSRSLGDIANFRAKRGAQKKLRDEVVPVLHHVKFRKLKGNIRFQLSNAVPDCWIQDSAMGGCGLSRNVRRGT